MDNSFNDVPVKSHGARAFLGFFLTFLITVFFIVQGVTISLKTSILKDETFNDTLETMGFYDTLQELIVSEISKSATTLGLSEDAIDTIFSKDTIKDVSEILSDGVLKGKKVDISFIKEDCISIAKDTTNKAVDSIFNEFEDSSKTIDITSITNNNSIKKIESDYNIELSKVIEDTVSNEFGTTTIDLSVVDSKQLKTKISDTLITNLNPAIEKAFDMYVDDVNTLINDAIDEINSEYNMKNIFSGIDNGLKRFSYANILLILFSTLLIIIQLTVYNKDLYRGFRNVSICALISGIVFFLSTVAINFVKDLLFEELDTFDQTEKLLKNFFENIINGFANSVLFVCIGYIVIFIAFIITSSVLKSKKRNKE